MIDTLSAENVNVVTEDLIINVQGFILINGGSMTQDKCNGSNHGLQRVAVEVLYLLFPQIWCKEDSSSVH